MAQQNISLTRYLVEQQRADGLIPGQLRLLLEIVARACKSISQAVNKGALGGVLGTAESENVQGEIQKKLDIIANEVLIEANEWGGHLAAMASEEMDSIYVVPNRYPQGEYLLLFDPLDGSSNIDVNVSVGTIFSVLRRDPDPTGTRDVMADVLQAGYKQIAAGYVVYGSSTMLVYSAGNGVHGFTLDPSIGAYLMSHENMQMPTRGTVYSCNEANFGSFPPGYQGFLHHLRSGAAGRTYSSRYIGSLVADFHRTLLKGGIFLYPPTISHPQGKLRLLYEANPMAFLAEQAGGLATDGDGRILDIQPSSLHQRTPLIVGSREEVELLSTFVGKSN
jgi:fructose-1,6-bisphosphatase I